MKNYTIKPLKWKKRKLYVERHRAETIFGDIDVEIDGTGKCSWSYCFIEYYDEDWFACKTIASGKKKAEAFYLKKLKKALKSPATVPATLVSKSF